MKSLARTLRKNSTDAEGLLWRHLRNRQLANHKFRRQEAIGPYIVDFVCIEQKLVVEVDGGQHAERVEQDDNRTEHLEKLGYRVMRFWNNDVLSHCDAVLEAIAEELTKLPSPRPSH